MKKPFCILLSVLMLLPLLASCGSGDEESSDALYIEGLSFVIKPGDTEFTASQLNSYPVGDNIAVYTRNYRIDGAYSLVVGTHQEGRTAFSVRLTYNDNKPEFDIVARTTDVESAQIPVNGFAFTIPDSKIESLRANVGQLVEVSGYDALGMEYERMDLASFSPSGMTGVLSRRINLSDPVNGIKEDKITYVTGKSGVVIPGSSFTAKLEKVTTYGYKILSCGSDTSLAANEIALVFTGEYNIAYAEKFLKTGEKLMFNKLEEANSYSDNPAVIIGNTVCEAGSGFVNEAEPKTPGVYLYNSDFSDIVTPKTEGERVDVTVIDGTVAAIGKNGARSLIPSGNGVTFTFFGKEEAAKANSLSVGDEPQTVLIETTEMPEKYVRIDDTVFEVDFLNGYRQPEGVCVLYTSAFGKTTGTNEYGTEIVIEDDKVTKVSINSGDSEIPENGYVLSIHNTNSGYRKASSVSVGSEVTVSLAGNDYSVTKLAYTGVNTARYENNLIVYKDVSSTATNVYGYEIIVSSDGTVTGESYSGNSAVPAGGFVLSGHGTAKEELEELYLYGEKVILDTKKKRVVVIRTPELKIGSAQSDFDYAISCLDDAKKKMKDLDYQSLGETSELLSSMLASASASLREYDYAKAISLAVSVSDSCENLLYSLIESKGAENRAVWYRSSEKSDEEVEATIQKMKSLNLNALYIETWYDGYCIGKIDVEGIEHNPRNGNYDALEGFVRIGHQYGIEVHAWCENFFIGYYDSSNAASNSLISKWSDKLLIDSQGNDYYYYQENCSFVFLDPYTRECRDLVLSVYKAIIEKYDIDGLHLDYIRFPEYNYQLYDYGYNSDILAAFKKQSGISADPRSFESGSSEMQKWNAFRREIITSFVGEVYDLVCDTRPELWLTAATYPEVATVRNTIFQDVKTWVDNGWLDEVLSMSYGADNSYVSGNAKMYSGICRGKSFYSAGIQAFSETAKINFAYQLTEVISAGADGVSVFSLGSITPDTYQYQMTSGAFRDPSVQTYRFCETVKAQADYIVSKLDNIEILLGSVDKTEKEKLVSALKALSEKAAGLDLGSMSVSERIAYSAQTVKELKPIYELCSSVYGTGEGSPCGDLEDLEYWLTLSAERLSAKTK